MFLSQAFASVLTDPQTEHVLSCAKTKRRLLKSEAARGSDEASVRPTKEGLDASTSIEAALASFADLRLKHDAQMSPAKEAPPKRVPAFLADVVCAAEGCASRGTSPHLPFCQGLLLEGAASSRGSGEREEGAEERKGLDWAVSLADSALFGGVSRGCLEKSLEEGSRRVSSECMDCRALRRASRGSAECCPRRRNSSPSTHASCQRGSCL